MQAVTLTLRILYGVASFLFEAVLAVECLAACVALGSLIFTAVVFFFWRM